MNRSKDLLAQWFARHRSPLSLVLHAIGIPMTIVAAGQAIYMLAIGDWAHWWSPVTLVTVGYGLQWIGHRYEGNDMGEVILIKRMLRRPYRAVSPRYATPDRAAPSRSS